MQVNAALIMIQAGPAVSVPWWIWTLVILAAFLVVGWSLMLRSGPAAPPPAPPAVKPAEQETGAEMAPSVPQPATEPASSAVQPDASLAALEPELEAALPIFKDGTVNGADLKRVMGITPPVVTVLHAAGIHTFAELADKDVDQLERILRSAGIRHIDPSTWPHQARLAASGDWDALHTLQNQLNNNHKD